ncbi:MAG: M6 family metalloprotease domain-containing protein [Acidobacteriota bacterium]|nr:M6 family metalloprotease domain-containing protein [Acidobacteriota bacterium]
MFVCLFLALAVPAAALEPPTRAEIAQSLRDGTYAQKLACARALGNHIADPALIGNLRARLARILRDPSAGAPAGAAGSLDLPGGRTGGLPAKGAVRVFALLLDFTDYPAVNSAATIASKLFADGDGGYPYESLRNYYRRASYNMLEIGGSVLGWYRPSAARASMAMTTSAREALIKEALTHFDDLGHDFSPYDNDGDGTIDYFIVVWAGPNNGWANFWWGYQTSFSNTNFVLDGKKLSGAKYSWQWEARNWPGAYDQIVVMHETGHALGLPDYYDYDDMVGPGGGLGGLDMMDANRGDHNGFSKMLLDWITPQSFAYGTKGFSLAASGGAPEALILMPEYDDGQPFDEFYMVQNRTRTGNDASLPGDGLIIWHVDARLNAAGANFLFDNSYTGHKLLRLMEADGLEQIERGYAANAADYYTAGRSLSPLTVPDSDRYDGTSPGVAVDGIGPSGPAMSFNADIHYTLLPPVGASLVRLESDFIFFIEYIDKLTWSDDSLNHTRIETYRIYKKPEGQGDEAYVLLAEIPAESSPLYENRGLKKDEAYVYRIIAIDSNGVESEGTEVRR